MEIPVMHAANHLRLTAALSSCAYDISMSDHARQRAYERSSLAPSRVYELIASRQAVLLPFSSANRSYHLFFDKVKTDFLVGVVAIDGAGRQSASASVVTLLTRAQFECDAGPIGARALRTAACRELNPVAFRHWEEREFGLRGARRTYRVVTYFRQEDGSIGYQVFRHPPLCADFVETHGLTNAAGHPGFWDWYARRAKAAGLPVESVVSMRIADTDKVRLDLSAPAMHCPCCARKKT
jgi:hypothetical protein